MVKTLEDILQILQDKCCIDSSVFTTEDINDCIISPLKECAALAGVDWTWDEGMSKLVLIFREFGFVIKIPYTGTCERKDSWCEKPCDNCSKWSNCDGCDYSCSRRLNWVYEEENTYCEFYNARDSWDYCKVEASLYEEARAADVGECFAGTTYLGDIDEHPIYVQPLASIYAQHASSFIKHSKEEKISTQEACKRIDGWCFNVDWLTDFICFYGDEMFQKFMNFIKEKQITDLHDGNVGYICGRPVLVDYSGFND